MLRTHGPMTRAQLARRSGMPKSTVSVTVAELVGVGRVREQGLAGQVASGRGRPGTVVTLDPGAGTSVGLDFGFARLRVVVVDAAHQVIARGEHSVGAVHSPELAVEAATSLVESAVADAAVPVDRVLGVGVSFPLVGMQVSALDAAAAGFPGSHMRPGWEGVDIVARLSERLPYGVIADNDANCAARGELLWGAGRPFRDFLYFKLHSGVGGALVLDGVVRTGRTGGAGEFGHITLDAGGPLCRCGNRGCLEAYVGIPALLGSLQPWFPQPLTLGSMLDLLAAKNPACTRAVLDAAHHVGQAAGALCNAINPEAVILGGALSRAGEPLLGEARRAFAQNCLAINADVELILGEHAGDAGCLGAAALVLASVDAP